MAYSGDSLDQVKPLLVSIDELLQNPNQYFGLDVSVSGIPRGVCSIPVNRMHTNFMYAAFLQSPGNLNVVELSGRLNIIDVVPVMSRLKAASEMSASLSVSAKVIMEENKPVLKPYEIGFAGEPYVMIPTELPSKTFA